MPKRIITVLIVLLILALAMYFVPCPRFIEFRSNCVVVDRQGNVLSDEGEIFLKGIYYHYLFQEDTFQLTDLELPTVDVIKPLDDRCAIHDAPRGYDFIWIPCGFLYTDPNGKPDDVDLEFANIFTHPDFPYLIFQYGDMNTGKYFVSTNTNAPTPVEMLKEFCLYQENLPN